LALRLARRRRHLLAVRICDWVGHPKDRVLFHWACAKIKHTKKLSDEQLCEAILEKFRGCRGIAYADVARTAAEMHRPHLATMLLNHESRAHAQVRVLTQLCREGDDESNLMMLKLAVEKACSSYDPDLLFVVISTACGGDPSDADAGADIRPLAALARQRPVELQVISEYLEVMLRHGRQLTDARRLHETLGHAAQAAEVAVQQALVTRDVDMRKRMFADAKDLYSKVDGKDMSEAEQFSMRFGREVTAEEEELLRKQEQLEERSLADKWLGGPHRFIGLSLVDTLRKLIELGEIATPNGADNLRQALKVPDKRYWRIKILALSDCGNLSELNDLAVHRTSPVGYEYFVEAFLKHKREDLAKPLVAKVKSPEMQASFYYRMGMEEEGNAVMRKEKERSQGAGRFFQMFSK